MDELAAFLAARLAEDEAAAQALGADRWDAQEFSPTDWAIRGAGMGPRAVADTWKPETAAHIARHDPARVLREVAVLRSIVTSHHYDRGRCDSCEYDCPVAALAAIWQDHPDYRDEWRPS
jgi:hypothetical protein